MNIQRLDWDDRNIQHIARHGVKVPEAEEVCHGEHFARRESGGRYILAGKTAGGRCLQVVVEQLGKGQYRVITAFEMSESYRSAFLKRTKGKQ